GSSQPGATGYIVYNGSQTSTTRSLGSYATVKTGTTTQQKPNVCGHSPETTRDAVINGIVHEHTVSTDNYSGGGSAACWKNVLHQQTVTTTRNYPAEAANNTPATSSTLSLTNVYEYFPATSRVKKETTTSTRGPASRVVTYT